MIENPIGFKQKLYASCLALVNQKLEALHHAFAESRAALQSEAKSTAGDKHETGRAMLQLEQEKMSRQLLETERLKVMLSRVPFEKSLSRAQSGALVQTMDGLYFLAVGLGQMEVNGLKVFVMAPPSPLGQAMLGKSAGESFEFRDASHKILSIA